MITSGTITEEEYETWLTPSQALDLIGPTVSVPIKQADIARRLSDGLIRSAANTLAIGGTQHHFVALSGGVWESWACLVDHAFWGLGTRSGSTTGRSATTFNAYGVRFEPRGIERMVPDPLRAHKEPPQQARPVAPLAASLMGSAPRGRPQKSFWDDAILAVAQTIHIGDFKPERQADVQRALADWLSANGHEAGDTAIKERARKLFNSFKN